MDSLEGAAKKLTAEFDANQAVDKGALLAHAREICELVHDERISLGACEEVIKCLLCIILMHEKEIGALRSELECLKNNEN